MSNYKKKYGDPLYYYYFGKYGSKINDNRLKNLNDNIRSYNINKFLDQYKKKWVNTLESNYKRRKAAKIISKWYLLKKGLQMLLKSDTAPLDQSHKLRNIGNDMILRSFGGNQNEADKFVNEFMKRTYELEMKDKNVLDDYEWFELLPKENNKILEENDPYYLYSGIRKIIIRPFNGKKFKFDFDIYKYKDKNYELRGHWVIYWDKHDNSVGIDFVPENKRTYVSHDNDKKGKVEDARGNIILNNVRPDFRKRNRFYLYDLGKFYPCPYTFDCSVIGIQDGETFIKKFKYKPENEFGESREMGVNIGYKDLDFASTVMTNRPPKQYIRKYFDK